MRGSLGAAGIAVLAVACCAGLPLLLAAGLSIAALAWIGGVAVGFVALAAALALIVLRVRRRRAACNVSTRSYRGGHMTAIREQAPLVEILYFDGCPNHEGALALVEKVAGEIGIEAEIRLVDVPDQESASRLRFLGSPTVRVGGRDVEPGVDERTDYALPCRVFRTEQGYAGQPDEQWIREALLREAGSPAASGER
jgi:hypothetical protein